MKSIALALIASCISSNAIAQTVDVTAMLYRGYVASSSTVPIGSFVQGTLGNPFTVPLSASDVTLSTCPGICSASGQITVPNVGLVSLVSVGGGTINASSFAPTGSVANLQSSLTQYGTQLASVNDSLAGLQSSFAATFQQINVIAQQLKANTQALSDRTADYAAMASAMQIMAPVNGLENRVGFNAGTAGGHQAVSLSYVRVIGDMDFQVAGAVAGSRSAGHVGLGISW